MRGDDRQPYQRPTITPGRPADRLVEIKQELAEGKEAHGGIYLLGSDKADWLIAKLEQWRQAAGADADGASAQPSCPACHVLAPGPHEGTCFIAEAIGARR